MKRDDSIKLSNHETKSTRAWIALLVLLYTGIGMAVEERTLIKRILPCDENNAENVYSIVNSMALDNDRLFILENLKSRVVKARIENNRIVFVKRIGKKGKGPGDLNLPAQFTLAQDRIIIKDQEGVSFFTSDGQFITRFRLPRGQISNFYADGTYYSLSANPDSKHLIELYSENGTKKGEIFAKYLDIDFSKNRALYPAIVERYFYSGHLYVRGGFIYYLNDKFGTVFKLDLSGKVIASFSYQSAFNPKTRAIFDLNVEALPNGIKVQTQEGGGVSMPSNQIFMHACFFKDKLYLIGSPEWWNSPPDGTPAIQKPSIMRFDLNAMKPDGAYMFTKKSEEWIESFTVGEEQAGVFFLVAQEMEEGPAFVKYSMKKDG
jgi:hypothetical protein